MKKVLQTIVGVFIIVLATNTVVSATGGNWGGTTWGNGNGNGNNGNGNGNGGSNGGGNGGGGTSGGGTGGGVPLDGGLSLLLAGGAGLGIKKIIDKRKKVSISDK